MAVQAENCCPLLETYAGRQPNCHAYQGRPTLANGLAVPHPLGEAMMLQVLRESRGTVVAISEEDMLAGMRELGASRRACSWPPKAPPCGWPPASSWPPAG